MESTLLNIKHTRIRGLLKEQEENNNTILKNNLVDLGVILDGTFTFGTGITAFLPIVRDLINQQQPNITEQTIGLLYITAMWIILNRHGDKVKKLIEIIREQGLTDALAKVIDFLKSLEDVVLKVADEVGYAASTIADVGAFTFLAFPLLDGLSYLINDGNITFGEPSGYLKSVLISIGILSIKNVFNSVIRRVKSRFGTLDESLHVIRYDDLGIGSDVLSVVRETLFVESKELWVLPQDIDIDKEYVFNGQPHHVDLYISRNSKLKESYSINITEEKTNNFKVVLEINPLYEPKVYKNIKSTLNECFGKYGYPKVSMTLNEQSNNKTVRNVYEDADYKILVPLNMDAFCALSSGTPWCDKKRQDVKYRLDQLSRGTSYFLHNKKTNEKTLIHDSSRVFLLRDGSGNYNVTTDTMVYPTGNIKQFLSATPALSEFFNVNYTSIDKIRYDRKFADEELIQLATTNNFAQAVYDVMKGDADNILLPYLGDGVETGDYHDFLYSSSQTKPVMDITTYGVSFFFTDRKYVEDILNIEEDDSYYYQMAMGGTGYYNDCDSLEWEELDFMCDKLKTSEIKRVYTDVLKLLDPSLQENSLCDEGILSELLTKYYEKEWSSYGDDMLYELGNGLCDYRIQELKEVILQDLVIEAESVSNDGWQLDLTYPQLLGLIKQFNLKSFTDLLESGFNEIDSGLNDTYYDAWGYGDETVEEVSRIFTNFLDYVIEEGEIDIDTRKNHYEEFDRVVKDLGFEKNSYNQVYDKERTLEDWTGNTYKIYYQLARFNPIKNTVSLYVGLVRPYGNINAQVKDGKWYEIKINQVSDYVTSEDLFAPEQMKIKSGQYKGDTEILKNREETQD